MSKDIFVGTTYKIPLATSVELMLNAAKRDLRSDRYNATLADFEAVRQFGFNPLYIGLTATNNRENFEDVLTADQTFYRNGATGTDADATFDDTIYTLDSRVVETGYTNGWNSLELQLSQAARSFFDATAPPTTLPRVPYYRLSRLKLENPGQLNATTREFETLDPGYKLDIRAYVYAQEGSWQVLPGGYFDDTIKTDGTGAYQELDAVAGRGAGESADLNGDGVVSRGEQVAAYRFARYNYEINFTGAIMEQKTATVADPDGTGTLTGQVADWTDKWATVRLTAANFTGANFTPATVTAASGNLGTIKYNYDPAAAIGNLDNDAGFHPPVSSELLYQSG
nr:hypothetical protein [uncultured bacterium]